MIIEWEAKCRNAELDDETFIKNSSANFYLERLINERLIMQFSSRSCDHSMHLLERSEQYGVEELYPETVHYKPHYLEGIVLEVHVPTFLNGVRKMLDISNPQI